MSNYTKRRVTNTRVEYVLKSPTNWVDITKVFSAIDNDFTKLNLRNFDDSVRVESRDDEIVFSYLLSSESDFS